jgi:hypothetical protein
MNLSSSLAICWKLTATGIGDFSVCFQGLGENRRRRSLDGSSDPDRITAEQAHILEAFA